MNVSPRSVSVVMAFACAGAFHVALAQPSCQAIQPDFVQVSITQLDAGERIFDDFRILATDVVQWARWDSKGALLGQGTQSRAGKNDYQRALVAERKSMLQKSGSENEAELGRPAFRLEVSSVSKLGSRSSTYSEMPMDLGQFVTELRQRIVPDAHFAGLYVWTKPFGPSGQADIDLSQGACTSGVARTLAEALSEGRLLMRADSSAQKFLSGERANRIEFIAKTKTGPVRFGIVVQK